VGFLSQLPLKAGLGSRLFFILLARRDSNSVILRLSFTSYQPARLTLESFFFHHDVYFHLPEIAHLQKLKAATLIPQKIVLSMSSPHSHELILLKSLRLAQPASSCKSILLLCLVGSHAKSPPSPYRLELSFPARRLAQASSTCVRLPPKPLYKCRLDLSWFGFPFRFRPSFVLA
jgi:hypothetical protein